MAFDPANPSFYGSCLQVDFARDVTGRSVGSQFTTGGGSNGDGAALRYLYNDTDHQWANPGDAFLVGFYPEPGLLTAADQVTFELVIELRGDSTGTLRLAAGVDPAWELLDPTRATEELGTFNAAGGGDGAQIVVPIRSWTGAMILAGQVQPVVLVEATAGLPRIFQTRVRMWPPGGVPVGTWESDPDYVIEDVEPRFVFSDGEATMTGDGSNVPQYLGSPGPRNHTPGPGTWGGVDDMGDTGAAFEEMQAHLIAHGIPAYQSFRSGVFTGYLIRGGYSYEWGLHRITTDPEDLPTHDWSGGFYSGIVLIVADPRIAGSRQDGYVYPDPDRVPGEWAAGVRNGRTGGTLESVFVAWSSQPQLLPSDDTSVGVRTFTLATEPWDATETGVRPGGPYTYYFSESGIEAAAGPAPNPPNAEFVPIPNIPIVGVEVNGTHGTSFELLGSGEAGGAVFAGSRTVDVEHVRARHRYEDVQWYNPGGVAKPSRKPRFYVTYTEVDERPVDVSHVVGIGKPADDASIFRVPTPLGTLRELRHGEMVSDVSVAYPLKVKLYDGSWTVVAGMTPDD